MNYNYHIRLVENLLNIIKIDRSRSMHASNDTYNIYIYHDDDNKNYNINNINQYLPIL